MQDRHVRVFRVVPAACLKQQSGECARKYDAQPSDDGLEKKVGSTTSARVGSRSKVRELPHRNDGQSLVEFALAVPLLLMIVTGITAFGVVFNHYIMLTEATSVGARQLAVSRGQTLDPCQTFSAAVSAAAPLLKTSSLTFTLTLNGDTYTGTSCSGSVTSGAPADMVLGTSAVVKVTYPYSLGIFRSIVSNGLLTAQTTELMQ